MAIDVFWVTSDRFDDLENLFATSRGVRACWCMWPRSARGTHKPDPERNRKRMRALIEDGESPGLLAYVEDRPVGWCAFGPRDAYPQYAAPSATDVWAIACLFVRPRAAANAVSASLIDYAVGYAKAKGARQLEGPPIWWLPGDAAKIVDMSEIFLANGFERIRQGARMPMLRRFL